MIVLTVCNHKGGTGKTTSVIHIAAALGLSGYRTLVVDLDPQCFLTHMLGVEEPPDVCSSAMLFNGEVALRDVPVHSVTNFDLVPSSRALTRLMRRLNKPTDVYWAKESLKSGIDYDVVIFDTAAAVTVYSLNSLVASDWVLIPVTPEYQPVVGAEQTVRSAEVVRERLNPDLHEPFFMFTQVDYRKNSHRAYRQYMRGKYGSRVMHSLIRTSTALAEGHSDGSTAFDHDPHSRGARDYANATDELLKRMLPDENAGTLFAVDSVEAPSLPEEEGLPENPRRPEPGPLGGEVEDRPEPASSDDGLSRGEPHREDGPNFAPRTFREIGSRS